MKDWAEEARQAWLKKMGARQGLLGKGFEYVNSASTDIRRTLRRAKMKDSALPADLPSITNTRRG